MYALDFYYDNRYLSDYGFIVCNFDFSSGSTTANAGSKISFETVPMNQGKRHSLYNTSYSECIEASFDICKNPDEYDDLQITNDEYRELVRWLNRREYLKFQVVDEEYENNDACYYNASFNVEKIMIAEKLYGLRLTLHTDKPFGYGDEQKFVFDANSSTKQYLLTDISDEIGDIYPDMKIEIKGNGNLKIANTMTGDEMVINNCQVGEVITVYGDSNIIETTRNAHKLYDDFNFTFLRIGNDFEDRINKLTFSIPCKATISYKPVIKDSPN